MMTILGPGPAVGPAAGPPAYAAAAKAKLERDRKSFAAFRAADQSEHEKAHELRVTAAVTAAEDDLRLWREDLEQLEPEAAAALAGFRDAEDRARTAREYARQRLAAYELVKGKGSPEEETSARLVADAADETAANAAKLMAGKQAELTVADQSLAEARDGLAEAEHQLGKLRKAAERPAGPPAISDVTIRACAAWMQSDEIWNTLSRADKQRVHRAGEPRALISMPEFLRAIRDDGVVTEESVA